MSKSARKRLNLTARCELEAAASKPARASIVAYRGGIMRVEGVLVLIDLAGLETAGPVQLLSDHDNSRGGVIGAAEARIDRRAVLLEGAISRKSPAGREIIALAQDGVRWQASVGVTVKASRLLKRGDTVHCNGRDHTAPDDEDVLFVRRGLLREVSIVALGADADTSVTIKAKDSAMTKPTERTKRRRDDDRDADTIRNEERDRIRQIEAACRGISDGDAHRARIDALREQAISGDITIEALQAGLLDMVRTSRPHAPRQSTPSIDDGGGYGVERRHIVACLLLRAGFEKAVTEQFGERVAQQASEIRAQSLVDLAAMCVRLDGGTPPRNQNELLRAALSGSTFTLPLALGDAINRTLTFVYKETPATWRAFAHIKSAKDFRENTTIRPDLIGDLEEVGASGELKHLSLDEDGYQYQLSTYGKVLGINRQQLINDDLGFMDEVAPGMAAAALRKLSDLVYTAILANTGSHFSVGNGNLLSGGSSALSITSLAAAVAAMRSRTDADGNNIDMVPKTLVVPPELETTGKTLLKSQEIRVALAGGTDAESRYATGNALQSIVGLEVEPRLSNTTKPYNGASALHWYLFAGAMQLPLIVAYLNGQQTPTVDFFDLNHDATSLGVGWRVYHDFGCALGDPKAGQRSAGQ